MGLSQLELAQRSGISRQTVIAIEADRFNPSVAVGLRLAQALHCSIDELFTLFADAIPLVEMLGEQPIAPMPMRVRLARLGERLLALPLSGAAGAAIPADGVLDVDGNGLRATRFVPDEVLDHTLVIHGCDPALSLLGEHLHRVAPEWRALIVAHSSTKSLDAIKSGQAHVVGSHLSDPLSGESNLPYLRQTLPTARLLVVTLSQWTQGWLTRKGDRAAFRHIEDLVQPGVRLINREIGSGTRILVDAWLRAAGIESQRIVGYDQTVTSHFAVADAIAIGRADVGPGIEAVARALDLTFIPVQSERYDLVIPLEFAETPGVQRLLNTMTSSAFRRELASLGGYDTTSTGNVVAVLGAEAENTGSASWN